MTLCYYYSLYSGTEFFNFSGRYNFDLQNHTQVQYGLQHLTRLASDLLHVLMIALSKYGKSISLKTRKVCVLARHLMPCRILSVITGVVIL